MYTSVCTLFQVVKALRIQKPGSIQTVVSTLLGKLIRPLRTLKGPVCM